jgi:hypothetical protein
MSSTEWKMVNFINNFISKNSDDIVNNNWRYTFEDILYHFQTLYPNIHIYENDIYGMKKSYKKILEFAIKTAHPEVTKKDLNELFTNLKI